MKSATIEFVSKGESAEKAKLMIDEQPASTWTSSNYNPSPVITFDRGVGQVCFFIDRTKPQIFDTPLTQARLIEIVPRTAFWGELAREEWKSSVAVSEVMLFNAPAK